MSSEELEGGVTETGSDDAFDKAIRLGDLESSSFIHFAIEAQDAAVGAERVAFIGLAKGFFEAVRQLRPHKGCCA